MLKSITALIRDEEGATALEYGLIAALIAAVIVAAVTALGTKVSSTFSYIDSKMPTPGS
ncbi:MULTISPECIES: Flp family type IVb pilin [Nitratidesulfovibrio]|jgi:pilus assembly protein Flp/PilA|uniref:Flp family type IVb pilin n=1 Tax=Nitratidesulfovibrio liaohensis TaxID=2604158 RepID=A0ABY9QZX2_9BACT|nr:MULTISPECIES: Flp family type IVb pilin [Nitratidesulfovibrio]EGY24626.1 flp/Fap pilin component family protein [Desulfovibrio sp. A2]WMW65075.1 Flp family type IVb pilin [Nitratidesulfovibrio liaohensis]